MGLFLMSSITWRLEILRRLFAIAVARGTALIVRRAAKRAFIFLAEGGLLSKDVISYYMVVVDVGVRLCH